MAFEAISADRISHYRIEQLLGEGGMGLVYRAIDERLGRRVAIKLLHPLHTGNPALRQRFIEEARAASSLDHPNVCTIFEVDETAAGTFIAMAYYEGETLDRIIQRGRVPVDRAINLTLQAARGLAAAHEELIVHRDVKPGNIMVTRNDTVKLLDFGLAVLVSERPDPMQRTITGTPAYMSPEQVRGETIDRRSDVWSLGVVLYEMLTGLRPFAAPSLGEIARMITTVEPAPPRDVVPSLPARADAIIIRAMAKDPRLRYEQMDDMVADLLAIRLDLDPAAVTMRRAIEQKRVSVAVLPFYDMSAARDQEYLCDGLAEEILGALARIPDLHVVSRTSAFHYKSSGGDIREIGSRLGVDTIVEGSIRRFGERLRISAQLINVADGYRLWCDRFDREMKDIFAVQDEIAEKVAEALQVSMVERRSVHGAEVSTRDAEAYSLYLQGRQFFHLHRRKAFEVAIQTFERVIQIDPLYARAFAGIANCHAFLHLYFGAGKDAVEACEGASSRAVALAPDLAEAHASRGVAHFIARRFDEAESELSRAIEIDPRLYDAHYFHGRVSFSRGRPGDAAHHFERACTIVPEAYDAWYLLGMCYRRVGQTEKGRAADLECVEAVKKRVQNHLDDTRAWTMGAAVLAQLGEPDRAAEWVTRALAIDSDESIIVYNAACVYVALGRFDDALDLLERSVVLSSLSRDWVANDPDLDPLRSDPRFQELCGSFA